MPIAAVPHYMGKDFSSASPGMRFGMYLSIWTNRTDQEHEVQNRANQRSREGQEVASMLQRDGMDAVIQALTLQRRRPLPSLWQKNDFASRRAWDGICKLSAEDAKILQNLLVRQQAAFTCQGTTGFSLRATTVAPFTTGLGNEHPLENGFAFLWPYGLPYLPGSGVKGVVRRTAEELAEGIWGDTCGWSHDPVSIIEHGTGADTTRIALSAIDVLFGREPQGKDSPAVRGVLTFWDVIPQIAGSSLMVEIMTPHQTHYYQQRTDRQSGGSTSPHDSGQPNPISFLTIPPGSTFVFHVLCDTERLKRIAPSLFQEENGTARWQNLLHTAFIHAFSWFGFGAKTAVGYGAMEISTPESTSTNQQKTLDIQQIQETTEQWPQAYLKYDPGSQKITATFEGRQATFLGQIHEFWQQLGEERTSRIKKKKSLGNIPIIVRKQGNYIEIIGVNDASS
ncbi:MAG TPA: type III-B CRISPR module RAMP protein Cmr6 [Desulfomicrobiaceae bacterium]|jgi:CRISPR-associated protein Cmr6|nr:type III-B CRISPR module RAMP protein Cmr6 [Desulfomicrobiaceae bacterium]